MFGQIMESLRALHHDEEGAAMVEYAIITAGIAVVALAAVQALGTAIVGVFNGIVTAVTRI